MLPTRTTTIHVVPVESEEDWMALADIRFDEWIRDGTSRDAFRLATKDLYWEERPKSMLFLAKQTLMEQDTQQAQLYRNDVTNINYGYHDSPTNMVTIGAAEISPYELEDALLSKTTSRTTISALYVTDVVTDRKYRRQGVARRLMERIEEHAAAIGTTHLLLHVAYENSSAIRLYGTLGYRVPTLEVLDCLDVPTLEKSAGTRGQILLEKRLQ